MFADQTSRLTLYEKAYLIGIRVLQLEGGAIPLTDLHPNTNIDDIAEADVNSGLLPFIIRRRAPGGKHVAVRVLKNMRCAKVD